jgi:hypothetical protein
MVMVISLPSCVCKWNGRVVVGRPTEGIVGFVARVALLGLHWRLAVVILHGGLARTSSLLLLLLPLAFLILALLLLLSLLALLLLLSLLALLSLLLLSLLAASSCRSRNIL